MRKSKWLTKISQDTINLIGNWEKSKLKPHEVSFTLYINTHYKVCKHHALLHGVPVAVHLASGGLIGTITMETIWCYLVKVMVCLPYHRAIPHKVSSPRDACKPLSGNTYSMLTEALRVPDCCGCRDCSSCSQWNTTQP